MATSTPGRRSRRRMVNEINVVPYIDVMLVLLVIFMVTAPMLPPGTIDLPSAGRSSAQPDRYIEVQVNASGELRVRGINTGDQSERRVGRGDLPGAIEQIRGDADAMPVVISGDRNVKYETVIDVMSDLRRMNIERIALLVKPAAGPAN